ncbi:MAG: alpha/beta hydrolase [Actinomycetota bacterium]|nr:alpha/beta hydrolase [Actinomycetota bacterium]
MRVRRTDRFYTDATTMRARLPEHQDPSMGRPPRDIRDALDVQATAVDGYTCWTLRPRSEPRSPMHVLHLHGGGFVEQMGAHHWWFAHRLIDALGCAVTFPMFPLVPEHDHRSIWPMVRHSYEQLLGPIRPEDRVIMGDSAGGGLTLSLAQMLRDRGDAQPSRLVLLSPWLDLGVSDPLAERIARDDPVLGIAGLRQAGRWYADGTELDDPEISPVHAELSGLGRTAVFVGTRDLLLADARRLRREAALHGQHVTLNEYRGMFHNWIMQPLPEARRARADLLRFLTH